MAGARMRKDKRLELLRGVPLFSACTKRELTEIEGLTSMIDVKEGTEVATFGTPGQEFFIIVDGSATASRNGLTLAVLGPGSFFGELALLDGGERTATVVADTDLTLLVLSRREFRSLQSTAPSVAYKLLVELGARLRQADAMLADLADRDSAAHAALSSL